MELFPGSVKMLTTQLKCVVCGYSGPVIQIPLSITPIEPQCIKKNHQRLCRCSPEFLLSSVPRVDEQCYNTMVLPGVGDGARRVVTSSK